MFNKISLYFYTLRYLKVTQIYYRIVYIIVHRLNIKQIKIPVKDTKSNKIIFLETIPSTISYLGNFEFNFLNIKKKYEEIEWNDNTNGKLWCYNLNYFDFLNQENLSKEDGLFLINNYTKNIKRIKTGLDSYPTSLRCINWIKFCSRYQIDDFVINNCLFAQYKILEKYPEYDLMGNHLLENGISLIFGAYYFSDKQFLKSGTKILLKELEEQILLDGGHFEQSPMYQQILIERLLDCYNLILNNFIFKERNLLNILQGKISQMLGWLDEITFTNGDIPYVNDSIVGISTKTNVLKQYANRLNLTVQQGSLSDSGYRMIRKDSYEILVDVGNITANYQPSHTHSDNLNFILNVGNFPIIVDTGTSTYENNQRRIIERSIKSHNGVYVNEHEINQIWSSFRVGKRAKTTCHYSSNNSIIASHNGYSTFGIIHKRIFVFEKNQIVIDDKLECTKKKAEIDSIAYIHFHPAVNLTLDNKQIFIGKSISINFEGHKSIKLESYFFADGFNRCLKAYTAIITFNRELKTTIIIK